MSTSTLQVKFNVFIYLIVHNSTYKFNVYILYKLDLILPFYGILLHENKKKKKNEYTWKSSLMYLYVSLYLVQCNINFAMCNVIVRTSS